jgi:activator of 2-hydroxyglutaryl-CoA dehydratase
VAAIAAARHFYPRARSILIIGAEKFGLIQLDRLGNYRTFRANTGCAAGTGSFLDQQARRLKLENTAALSALAQANTGTGSFIEEQAQKLGCPIDRISALAEHRQSPLASDRCTVFMERDISHYLSTGYSVNEVLAAVLRSVVENYMGKVAIESSIGTTITFQGARQKSTPWWPSWSNGCKNPSMSPVFAISPAPNSALP